MDVLTVGGKQYVKASTVARDLGYTADYVGQLCRSRKVNAKLIGRSWYVDTDSIQSHKSTRYRSTQTKSIKELREEMLNKSSDFGIQSPANFYTHNTRSTRLSYETDESELIPAVSKTKLSVELADAQKVSIRQKEEKYHFITPKLPEIKFKGTLQVTDYEPEVEAAETEGKKQATHIHPKVSRLERSKKPLDIAISAIHTSSFTTKLATQTSSSVVAQARPRAKEKSDVAITKTALVEETSLNVWIIGSGAVLAVALVLLCFGLEAHVLVQHEVVSTTYSFGLENLKLSASVYDAVSAFDGVFQLITFSTNLLIF